MCLELFAIYIRIYYQPIVGVRGFSRETLIALAANIEPCKWRYHYTSNHNLPSEHPQASSTDDVECFFSVLHDIVGKDFTLKEVIMSVLHMFVYQ